MGHEQEIWSKNEIFELQSARRVLKEYLDCVRKHRRCNKFKKWPQRKKSQHSWCWVVRSGREKDKSSDQVKTKSRPSDLIEGRSMMGNPLHKIAREIKDM
jgi:hypothetical protein